MATSTPSSIFFFFLEKGRDASARKALFRLARLARLMESEKVLFFSTVPTQH